MLLPTSMRELLAVLLTVSALAHAPGSTSQQGSTALQDRLFPITVDGRQGVIDEDGRVVIPPTYDMLRGFSEGLAGVWIDKKWGFIDASGQIVIKPQFLFVRGFSEGLADVETDNGWTFIDRSGKPITHMTFEQAGPFSDKRAPVKVAGLWGYIDQTGVFVIPTQYQLAWPFKNGLAIVYPAGDPKCRLIDTTGAVVLEPGGQDCRGHGPIAMREAGFGTKYGYVTAEGEPLTPFTFDWAEPFLEGLAAVRSGERTGFIDLSGKMAIPTRFDADPHGICRAGFSQGLSAVMIEGRCAYIDRTGVVRIEPRFDKVSPFRDDRAWVCQGTRCGYIDTAGKVIWMPPQPRVNLLPYPSADSGR